MQRIDDENLRRRIISYEAKKKERIDRIIESGLDSEADRKAIADEEDEICMTLCRGNEIEANGFVYFVSPVETSLFLWRKSQ